MTPPEREASGSGSYGRLSNPVPPCPVQHTSRVTIPGSDGPLRSPAFSTLVHQWWFIWPLALRLLAWLFLAQAYEMAVFQDAARQMVTGQGVYARFSLWLTSSGDGYYAAPPVYAYMLWASGRLATFLGDHWWLRHLMIKSWLLLADLAVMAYLLRRSPTAARTYWTLWFVPVVAIGQVQPDLWIGLCVLVAFHLALQERWLGAGILLGLASGIKPSPLLLLPFIVIYLIRGGRRKAIPAVGLGVLGAVAAGWLPYILMFPDTQQVTDVIRFHVARPIAGLTIPSGVLVIANAALVTLRLVGTPLPWAEAAYDSVVRAGVAYPVVTVGVFIAVVAVAASGRRWSLAQTFSLPLLAFLAANKVVHEHYVLQALPLLVALGMNLRGVAVAFSVYLLAAGGPLRYFPSELGLPSALDAILPPLVGASVSIGLAIVAGAAALAFGGQILALLAATWGSTRESVYNAAWGVGVRIVRAARWYGMPVLERFLGRVGTRLVPAPRRDLEVGVVDEIRMVVPSGLPSARTYARGGYEVPVTRLVRHLAAPGMGLVDVGAFCGYYTLLFSYLTGHAGTVYAFEPHPETFQYLTHNISHNHRANIVAVNMAVGQESGHDCLALHRWPDHHWVASRSGQGLTIQVRTVTLDDFFEARGWPRVDLVKVDVEGAELSVLRGMREVCRRNPQLRVIMEVDQPNLRRAGTTWAEVAATLRTLGFHAGRVIEQDLRLFGLKASAPTRITCNILVTRD